MSKTTRFEIVKMELYIINDEIGQDYEFGDCLYNSDPGTDTWDDACEACREIAKHLYKITEGAYKYTIKIELRYTYSYDYFYGSDEDLNWDYLVLKEEETDFWKEN